MACAASLLRCCDQFWDADQVVGDQIEHEVGGDATEAAMFGGGPAMLVRPVGQDHPQPWNKGALVGQKKPLQPKHVWSIRVRLEIARRWRDLALFNLAIDSKLRACDLVRLRIDEACSRAKIRHR